MGWSPRNRSSVSAIEANWLARLLKVTLSIPSDSALSKALRRGLLADRGRQYLIQLSKDFDERPHWRRNVCKKLTAKARRAFPFEALKRVQQEASFADAGLAVHNNERPATVDSFMKALAKRSQFPGLFRRDAGKTAVRQRSYSAS